MVPPPNNNDVTPFAETNFRNQRRRFGIKLDDRRRHMYVIGKTGMGKTTLLENMIIWDIKQGRGLAVVDPHGDMVEKVLDYIPPSRINDVVYFNPADIDFPIAFNALETVDPTHRHLIASGLVGVFKKIWADSWGPRLEYVLRITILSLLEYPGSTILGITRLLTDNAYRKKVVSRLTDPILRTFWVDEYASYSNQFRTEAISPIQNKVGQFLSSSLIRNIVGQTVSSINMREIMDDGKILLLNLAKGRIGEDNSRLLGAMMITKLQLAAMSRVDIPEEERKDFFLYVDEFQNFATESFANILSEARKYHLDIIIGHQYIEQLDEVVQPAVFGNVGTIVAFRVGAADAEFLEKEFEPVFMQNDLVNLAKYEMYLKLMIDGMASTPFSARGLPPIQFEKKNDQREKIIKVSRERYATPRDVVEDKIVRWYGHGPAGDEGDDRPAPARPGGGQRPPAAATRPTQPAPASAPRPAKPQGLRINLADALQEPTPTSQADKVVPAPEPAVSLAEALKKPPVPFTSPRREGMNRPSRPSSRPAENSPSKNPPRSEQRPRPPLPRVDRPPVTPTPRPNPQPPRPQPPAPITPAPSHPPAAPVKTPDQQIKPGQVIHFRP